MTATNSSGIRTLLRYDAFGRLTKVIADPDNPDLSLRATITNPTIQYNYYDTWPTPGGGSMLLVETWKREAPLAG